MEQMTELLPTDGRRSLNVTEKAVYWPKDRRRTRTVANTPMDPPPAASVSTHSTVNTTTTDARKATNRIKRAAKKESFESREIKIASRYNYTLGQALRLITVPDVNEEWPLEHREERNDQPVHAKVELGTRYSFPEYMTGVQRCLRVGRIA